MASQLAAKRKVNDQPVTEKDPKRSKLHDARSILTQTSDKALGKNGELDVPSFIKAREYEIKAMEAGMGASRKVLASRAFQELPKDMRRRTASHNIKRVPKRVRARAEKEVSKDNVATHLLGFND